MQPFSTGVDTALSRCLCLMAALCSSASCTGMPGKKVGLMCQAQHLTYKGHCTMLAVRPAFGISTSEHACFSSSTLHERWLHLKALYNL